MYKIIRYLQDQLAEDFHPVYYGLNAFFLIAAISFNYYVDLENSIIDAYAGNNIRILWYFLLYATAYYFSCFTYVLVFRNNIFKKREFWIKSLLFLFIIALDGSFHYHRPIIQAHFPYQLHYLLIKVSKNLSNIVSIVLPLAVFYKLCEKSRNHFYGMTTKGIDLKPYWILLLVMMPLIYAASLTDGFLHQYPVIKENLAATYLQWETWITVVIFELSYGWDFVSVELVFRGFMVIGMAKLLGKGAIVPITVTYAFYHFGKPVGETISSIFGGYILAVIALNTRSILGGVIVHIGIAWAMELFAFIQKSGQSQT